MKTGENHDCIIKDKIENGVGEFAKQSTMYVFMYDRVKIRISPDGPETYF